MPASVASISMRRSTTGEPEITCHRPKTVPQYRAETVPQYRASRRGDVGDSVGDSVGVYQVLLEREGGVDEALRPTRGAVRVAHNLGRETRQALLSVPHTLVPGTRRPYGIDCSRYAMAVPHPSFATTEQRKTEQRNSGIGPAWRCAGRSSSG
eukprot:2194851-Rhodomonas_salina.7